MLAGPQSSKHVTKLRRQRQVYYGKLWKSLSRKRSFDNHCGVARQSYRPARHSSPAKRSAKASASSGLAKENTTNSLSSRRREYVSGAGTVDLIAKTLLKESGWGRRFQVSLLPTPESIAVAAASLGPRTPADERLTLVNAPGANAYPLVNQAGKSENRQSDQAIPPLGHRAGRNQWKISGGRALHPLADSHLGAEPRPD
jgi:hypothetical protein